MAKTDASPNQPPLHGKKALVSPLLLFNKPFQSKKAFMSMLKEHLVCRTEIIMIRIYNDPVFRTSSSAILKPRTTFTFPSELAFPLFELEKLLTRDNLFQRFFHQVS